MSVLASLLRLGSGAVCRKRAEQPEQPLILYEFEGCPYCRKVREGVTHLCLVVDFRPCPKGGKRFRPELIERGGKAQFPYLIDPNTGVEMYESHDILKYLYKTYGSGSVPLHLAIPVISDLLVIFAMLPRMGRGVVVRESGNADPVELYGFEASPATRLVREQLCVREIPYRLIPSKDKVPRLGSDTTCSEDILQLITNRG